MAIGAGNDKAVAALSTKTPSRIVRSAATPADDGVVGAFDNMLELSHPADTGL